MQVQPKPLLALDLLLSAASKVLSCVLSSFLATILNCFLQWVRLILLQAIVRINGLDRPIDSAMLGIFSAGGQSILL